MCQPMNKYIFTFGSGHLYQGFYQPIYASNGNEARAKMVEVHGVKWSHQYTEEEWASTTKKSIGVEWERPLEAIYCD